MVDITQFQSPDYYYDSYSHFGVHEDMLKDKVRTLSYRNAMTSNREIFKDAVVLDVGCGTGILSLFAARCGARKVYAVEKSSIGEYAKEIVALNGYSDVIEVIISGIEDTELDEKVDVIISEWMGYCLFYEYMLPHVLFARDKYLKPGGTIFPNFAKLFIVAIEDREYREKKIDYWDNVYGFRFTPFKKWALLEPLVEKCPSERIRTTSSNIYTIDLNTCKVEDLDFTVDFSIVAINSDNIHAFVVWFDVEFVGKSSNRVVLSTSPYLEQTHWTQTTFYLEEPFYIESDATIKGTFSLKPNEKNPRDQDINITYTYDGRVGRPLSQDYKMR